VNSVLKSLVYGGLIAGTIDIGAASLINTISPLVILQAIASGLLGRAAFQGGAGVMVLGLLLQWGMSILIAAFFTLAAHKWTHPLSWFIENGIAMLVFGWIVALTANRLLTAGHPSSGRVPAGTG
jgi:hypothetical protein